MSGIGLGREYEKLPIVNTARRCGLLLDPRTLHRREVEAACPFCGDRGPGKHHLSLNTQTDQYRCNLCGASGNSVTLYAKLHGVSNREAYLELRQDGKVYPLPVRPAPAIPEAQPCPLPQRHAVYTEMLQLLTLSDAHRSDLLGRGLSPARIEENGYRSLPETESARRLLAGLLRSRGHDLHGVPGFYTRNGSWTLAGAKGFLIPVRDAGGQIQGFKIRLDHSHRRKYRWLSSRDLPDGTRSHAWIHITGNRSSTKAYLTEGPLKGDIASFLSHDALFVCIGGIQAIGGLRETLVSLGVSQVVEAFDMDQMTNPQVRRGVQVIRSTVRTIPHLKYSTYLWNPAYKGIDDYLWNELQKGA